MNKVVLLGRIGQEPELKKIGENTLVKFSLATTSNQKKSGEWVQVTQWHNVEFWGKRAETLSKLFKSGQSIAIDGRLEYDIYNNKEGVKVTRAKIVGNDWYFTGEKKSDNQEQSGVNDMPF